MPRPPPMENMEAALSFLLRSYARRPCPNTAKKIVACLQELRIRYCAFLTWDTRYAYQCLQAAFLARS